MTASDCGVAGFDVGATNVRFQYRDPTSGEIRRLQVRTADYSSLEETFSDCFDRVGECPGVVVAGIAGRPMIDGDVTMTNLPHWPMFRRSEFAARMGIRLAIVNDMMATVAGIEDSTMIPLTPDRTVPANPARLAVSVGSGVGSALMDTTGATHPAESGHVPWQPVTAMEHDYLCHLQEHHPGVTVSVEQAIGGLLGFNEMFDFMAVRIPPDDSIRAEVMVARSESRGIGPAITAGAVGGDRCCREILNLFGAIFGQYLRLLALVCLAGPEGGAIYLTSSVLQAPGVAELLMTSTPLSERFSGDGMMHADMMRQVPIFLIVDPHVAVKGAFALALRGSATT